MYNNVLFILVSLLYTLLLSSKLDFIISHLVTEDFVCSYETENTIFSPFLILQSTKQLIKLHDYNIQCKI